MSCETLNPITLQLSVTIAALPEGFCPASMQDLANAIGERIIISPNSDFNSFAIGSTPPSSNTGPWLKNCLKWFVYDDATASYLPITKGGFDNIQHFSSSGSFTVPEDIYKIAVELWGAGGGGFGNGAAVSGGSAGAGGYGFKIFDVTPGQIIPVTCGSGGIAGAPGADGGDSTFLTMTAGGGKKGVDAGGNAGAGGVVTGADFAINGQPGQYGSSGTTLSGMAGSSPRGGGGGFYDPTTAANQAGTFPGGGGAGAYSGTGGAGANGAANVYW